MKAAALELLGENRDLLGHVVDDAGHYGDGYLVGFCVGLLVAAGADEDAIQRFVEEVETTGRDRFGPTSWIFSGSEWGPHIKGLGRAPSVCFNEGFVRPDVLDAVNEWGAATWPGFVRASAASNAE